MFMRFLIILIQFFLLINKTNSHLGCLDSLGSGRYRIIYPVYKLFKGEFHLRVTLLPLTFSTDKLLGGLG